MELTGTETERTFASKMEANGWQVYKNGFPDFLCVKDGKFCLVEVKGNPNEKLRPHQLELLALMNNKRVQFELLSSLVQD